MTADQILRRFKELVPAFAAAWNESLFIDKDGSFTTHGIFSEFSFFFREHFLELTEETRREILKFVEECVKGEGFSEDVSNAACTCFLENIAGDEQLADVCKYLGPESREFFDQWN